MPSIRTVVCRNMNYKRTGQPCGHTWVPRVARPVACPRCGIDDPTRRKPRKEVAS